MPKIINIRGFIDYYNAGDYFEEIEEGISTVLEDLLSEGNANEVVELVEYLYPLVEKSMESVDDSDGGITDLLYRLAKIENKAYKQIKIEPVGFARKLFDRYLNSEFSSIVADIDDYKDILGEDGLAEYKKLVEEKWEQLPIASDTKREDIKPGLFEIEKHRYQITKLMEKFAEGDVYKLIEVQKKDLRREHYYEKLIKLYIEANELDQAKEAAEKGIEVFEKGFSGIAADLRRLLSQVLAKQGKTYEATQHIFEIFKYKLSIDSYQELKLCAAQDDSWEIWRPRAISLINEAIEEEKKQAAVRPMLYSSQLAPRYRKVELMVEVLLFEDKLEQAFEMFKSNEKHLSDNISMCFAERLEESKPSESIELYKKHVALFISLTNNDAYEKANRLMKKIKQLFVKMDNKAGFEEYLGQIKIQFRPKKNMMKLLEKTFC